MCDRTGRVQLAYSSRPARAAVADGPVALACGLGGFATLLSALARIALGVDQFLIQDFVAEIDAFIADVDPRARNQLAHLLLGFPAEGALQMGIEFGHRAPETSNGQKRTSRVGNGPTPRIVGEDSAVSLP